MAYTVEIPPSPRAFLREIFATEYCAECAGDARHHDAVLYLGAIAFARCKYPRDESDAIHPVIRRYRSRHGLTCEDI